MMKKPFCIAELGHGEEATVYSIAGGKQVRQRLINLGVLPGAKVKIVRINRHGPMVLSVQGGQVMIGRGMARHIYVSE